MAIACEGLGNCDQHRIVSGSQDFLQTLRENRAVPDMKDMKLRKLMLKHQNIQNA
jgi:hypothetical protein